MLKPFSPFFSSGRTRNQLIVSETIFSCIFNTEKPRRIQLGAVTYVRRFLGTSSVIDCNTWRSRWHSPITTSLKMVFQMEIRSVPFEDFFGSRMNELQNCWATLQISWCARHFGCETLVPSFVMLCVFLRRFKDWTTRFCILMLPLATDVVK